jgi:hypothetical protein
MLVFHSVLAAKPLAALHARPAANTLPPPAPQPTGPTPQPPAPLPRAVARKGAQNQNLGAVNGGRAQNTPNGNATSAAATNPAAPRDVPAQNMPRGTIGNDNRSPDNAQPAIQQPAQQPVALAANGDPSYVPTALDPAQTQGIGHPGPPGPRPLTSVPPAQPASVPAALANPQTAHPRLVPRAGSPNPRSGSEPNPSGPRPGAEPQGVTPPGRARSGQDISLRGSLRTQRPDFWLLLPPGLQKSGSDNQIASWLSANRPHEWAHFVKWLRENNYDAYAALPDALKSPQDRTAATVPTSSDNTNGREGPLNVRRWLNETGLWAFIPEDVRQRSNARIAQWLETDRPDLWTQFTAWLESRLPGRARPDPVEEEPTRFDSPPVSDVRGGRFASIDARTFVLVVLGFRRAGKH